MHRIRHYYEEWSALYLHPISARIKDGKISNMTSFSSQKSAQEYSPKSENPLPKRVAVLKSNDFVIDIPAAKDYLVKGNTPFFRGKI